MIAFLPSLANVLLTYFLALKFCSRKASLYAALIMSVCFLNVTNGHYIYTDNLLVMFVLISHLAFMRLLNNPSKANYVFAGAFTGIAVAAKYNAAVLIVPFFIAHIYANRNKKSIFNNLFNSHILLFIISVATFFIIFNPYSILDWRFFLMSIMVRIRSGYMGWSHHIRYSMFDGIGVIPSCLGLVGMAALIKKKFRIGLIVLSSIFII